MTRVLVADDDPQILRALRINLRARSYDVDVAADGATTLRSAAANHPDLVLLDLGLPDMDGVDIIRDLRGWSTVPIIVVSGRAGSGDKVAALDAGADDYITKPFGVDELLARIRAVTRRATPADVTPPTVRIGQYIVDFADHAVTALDGTGIHLTPTEWHLLETLARSPGKLIGRRQLLRQIWGPQYGRETHYIRQYMAQLRRKLEDDPTHPRHLITEPGMGYRLRITSASRNRHD
ncbi:MAG TPA: response regulator [Micromonosporaceae bacterium]|nr:response regulator [Micromonosporaceae bacterium]